MEFSLKQKHVCILYNYIDTSANIITHLAVKSLLLNTF